MPCSAITAVRSLAVLTSLAGSAARVGAAHSVVDTTMRARPFARSFTSSSCHQIRFNKFISIRKDAPDRFARRDDVTGKRRIAVLQQRQRLEKQHVVGPAQPRGG